MLLLLHPEALPGAIRLNWTVPADSTFSYMKISYVNPANQETVTNVVSIRYPYAPHPEYFEEVW